MMRAPVVILPCSSKAAYLDRYAEPDKGHADRDESWWPMPFWHMDAAMAALLILQTATDAGLGACFFGVFREPEVRREFGIPDRYDPVGVITLGHRADSTGRGSPAGVRRGPRSCIADSGAQAANGKSCALRAPMACTRCVGVARRAPSMPALRRLAMHTP